MQHRDKIILQKIVKEIDSAIKFLGDISQEIFLQDELLPDDKRRFSRIEKTNRKNS